jgi:type II secretory pathway pseudopilin PulG
MIELNIRLNMKTKAFPSRVREAFTFVELLVVLAVVFVLAGLIAPALGASNTRSIAAGCLNNLRQLQIAWRSYMGDNNDVMLPNAPIGLPAAETWDNTQTESWTAATGNTNVAAYISSLIGPYVSSNVLVLKCPADVVPSANGPRLRSYSMNGQMGGCYDGPGYNFNGGWLQYTNGSDLTRPSPANAFIFVDEYPGSINDGYFQVGLVDPEFPDVPASYIEGGCGFSFADGHAVIHQWQTTVLALPVVQGETASSLGVIPTNPDWQWITNHGGAHQ